MLHDLKYAEIYKEDGNERIYKEMVEHATIHCENIIFLLQKK